MTSSKPAATTTAELAGHALEVAPRSHLDTASRYPTEEQPDGVPILGPAGELPLDPRRADPKAA
jgi:hypothetical protein